MNSNAIEKIVAMAAIACIVVFCPQDPEVKALANAAITGICGLAGSGIAGMFRQPAEKKPNTGG